MGSAAGGATSTLSISFPQRVVGEERIPDGPIIRVSNVTERVVSDKAERLHVVNVSKSAAFLCFHCRRTTILCADEEIRG